MQQIFVKNILLATANQGVSHSTETLNTASFTEQSDNHHWAQNVLLDIDCNGLIKKIKPNSEISKDFTGQLINGAVIPGMVNNHSHAFQWAMAGLAEQSGQGNDSFWSWRKLMYDFVGKITPQDLHAIASALYMQMLKAGYTSVGEFHYLHHDFSGEHFSDIGEMSAQISQAAVDSGIGLTLLPVFYRYSGFSEQAPNKGQARFINGHDSYGRLLERVAQICQSNGQNFGIAPHSLRAVNKKDIEFAINTLNELSPLAPIHIHIAEQSKEVNDCIAHYGQRPVEWLANNFALDKRWCLVHATHINEQEVAAVAKAKSVVSICTTTEGNLGDGFFPMESYKANNGRWSIGSDSHISVNAAEELRWLEYQNRLMKQSRTVLTAGDYSSNGHWLWQQAALGGGQSMVQPIGQIKEGMRADFVELDTQCLSLMAKTDNQLLDAFIFNQQASNTISSVWVAGNKKIESGTHLAQDRIIENYRKTLNKLLS